ncbi:MAG: hypothetical protein H7Y41_02885 [Hyphomonadaceae bacterium]|nr:hypothetical protein [Clostridia bacterium]
MGKRWEESDVHQRNSLAYQAYDLNKYLNEINHSPYWAKPILSDIYEKWYGAMDTGNYKQAANFTTSKNVLFNSIDKGLNTFDKLIWLVNSNEKSCEICRKRDGKVYTFEQCVQLAIHPNCRCKLLPLGPFIPAIGSLSSDGTRLTVFLGSTYNDVDTKNIEIDTFLDWVQLTLDFVGLIPGVGEIADGINVLIYLGRGDVANALLSAGSAVPIAGWTFAGGKLAGKGFKIVKKVEKAEEVIEGASKAKLPNQGTIKGNVDGAPPVDAGKQGKHVSGHNNNNPSKSQWPQGQDGVDLTQGAWKNGKTLPDGTKVYDTGKSIGPNGETGVRVHIDGKGNLHGYPVDPSQYLK